MSGDLSRRQGRVVDDGDIKVCAWCGLYFIARNVLRDEFCSLDCVEGRLLARELKAAA